MLTAAASCDPSARLLRLRGGVSTPSSLRALVTSKLRPGSFLLNSPSDADDIEAACNALEAECEPPAWPRDLMRLDGTWTLLYSSTLAGSLRPPALAAPFASAVSSLLPDALRPEAVFGTVAENVPVLPSRVEQRVDVLKRRVVNVVEIAPWPSGGLASVLQAAPMVGSTLSALQQAVVTLELDHAFAVEGEGGLSGSRRAAAGSVVDLRLEQVRRTLDGAAGNLADLIPRESAYALPAPLSPLVAGSFDTTALYGGLRISRGVASGPLGVSELRIFVRELPEGGADGVKSWQEEEDELTRAAAAGEEVGEWEDRWQEGGDTEDFDSPD